MDVEYWVGAGCVAGGGTQWPYTGNNGKTNVTATNQTAVSTQPKTACEHPEERCSHHRTTGNEETFENSDSEEPFCTVMKTASAEWPARRTVRRRMPANTLRRKRPKPEAPAPGRRRNRCQRKCYKAAQREAQEGAWCAARRRRNNASWGRRQASDECSSRWMRKAAKRRYRHQNKKKAHE